MLLDLPLDRSLPCDHINILVYRYIGTTETASITALSPTPIDPTRYAYVSNTTHAPIAFGAYTRNSIFTCYLLFN